MNFTQELSLLTEGRMTNVWKDAAALSLRPTHLLLLTHQLKKVTLSSMYLRACTALTTAAAFPVLTANRLSSSPT